MKSRSATRLEMLTQNLKKSKLQYVIFVYKNFGDSAPTETS